MPSEYLSLKEVADLLRLSERTLYRHVKSGKLPAAKIGGQWRVRKSDVDRLFPEPPPRRDG